MAPKDLTFPGLGGSVTARLDQRAGASHAVIVVDDPDEPGPAEGQRSALVDAGFVVAWLPASHLDATDGMPRVEDLAGLLGTLFVSSKAKVGLVAAGRSCPVVLATVEGAYDLAAGAVLVDAGDAAADGPVSIVHLDADATPAAVVEAVEQLGFGS